MNIRLFTTKKNGSNHRPMKHLAPHPSGQAAKVHNLINLTLNHVKSIVAKVKILNRCDQKKHAKKRYRTSKTVTHGDKKMPGLSRASLEVTSGFEPLYPVLQTGD